jgi:hypothetical protein
MQQILFIHRSSSTSARSVENAKSLGNYFHAYFESSFMETKEEVADRKRRNHENVRGWWEMHEGTASVFLKRESREVWRFANELGLRQGSDGADLALATGTLVMGAIAMTAIDYVIRLYAIF